MMTGEQQGCKLPSVHQELNISGLRLLSIADSTFSSLKKLRVLDLRGNNLRQLQHTALAAPPALQEVYLSGEWILTQSCHRS
jgi:Leucine-rich repeat (LRR) protein